MAKERIVEIDLLRTIAIILMVVYHAAYDLLIFHDRSIDLWGDAWQALRVLTASLFLIVSGVAANFSHRPLRRSMTVIASALLISIVTYIYDPQTFIYFGILHCIGLGMLLLIPLKRLKELLIPIGILITLIPSPKPPAPTLDFYPPAPWLGLMLIGAGLGHYLYVRNDLRLPIVIHQTLTWPGRHALFIYLVHQPIVLLVLSAIA